MALQKLMEYIADAEESNEIGTVHHSFSPQLWPDDVSQGPFTEAEKTKLEAAVEEDAKCQALSKARRYLPCHYFDFICGSSTGA